MQRFAALCDVIERGRDAAEGSARLAPEVLTAAGEAGLWLLAAPVEVGGLELPLPELADVLTTVARADPSVAWHAMNSLGLATAAAVLDDKVRRVVIGNGERPFAYSGAATQAVAHREPDGYRLVGDWPFMTGAADAGWALVNGVLDDVTASQGGPPLRRFVVPLQELNIAGNWIEASAMRGTGSHAVATPPGGVFVPEERCLALGAPLLIDRPLYRIPTPIVFVGSAPSICVGTLRRAIDATVNLARGKRSRLDGQPHGEQVRVQQAIVNADADQRCLLAGYREVLEEIWLRVEASEPLDAATRARFWSTLFLVVDRCREHVSNLFAVATSAAYSTRNPIERALRDLHAASAALESFQGARWSAAQVMMGNDPRHPMF